MTDLLAGRIAVVTGAAHPRGIGRAILNGLQENGAAVVGTDLADAAGLEDFDGMACDVTDAAQCEAVVAHTIQLYGRIDILVNNAGIAGRASRFDEAPTDVMRRVVDVNVMGSLLCAQAAVNEVG